MTISNHAGEHRGRALVLGLWMAAGVIASGGIATPEHVHELARLQRDNLEGAIVGKALYDGRTTYEELSDATA